MSGNIKHLLKNIRSELNSNIDKAYRATVRDHYQMNVDNFLGVRTPDIRKIANQFYKEIKHLDVDEIFKHCDALLKTKIYEEKIIAFHWSFLVKKKYLPEYFDIFEHWLETYVDDWIDCDDFCTHTLGHFLYEYPKFTSHNLKWTKSDNRWLRRASAVSLIYALRRKQLLAISLKIANRILKDDDNLVLKAYGWMLKEGTKHFPNEVFDYVMTNKTQMPRVALRYAIEKLPKTKQKQAMAS